MKGALPPSSSETFFTVEAHCAIKSLPTSVEPVKENLRTSGFWVSSSPTSRARVVVTTLSTPAGSPAAAASSASARAESGVSSGGLTTTVQPAAMAGATLRVIMAMGKFQGVIAATTPIGCFSTRMRLPAAWVGMTSP
jgi:hypothetical protein